MASVGVGLNAQLGAEFWALALRFTVELALVTDAWLCKVFNLSDKGLEIARSLNDGCPWQSGEL